MSTPDNSRSRYQIECDCGRLLEGLRSGEVQTVSCPNCNESSLVLPASPMPVVPPRTGSTKRRKQRAPTDPPPVSSPDPFSADRLDDLFPPETAMGSASMSEPDPDLNPDSPDDDQDFWFDRRRKSRRQTARRGHAVKPPDSGKSQDTAESENQQDAVTTGRTNRLIGPIPLVLIGIAAAIGLTAWFQTHQGRLAEARRDLRDSRDSGLAAFEEARWGAAIDDLTVASRAADALGIDDRQTRLVNQRLREAVACSGLSKISLIDALERADVDREAGRDFSSRFLKAFGEAWLLLDSGMTLKTPDDRNRFLFDFPFLVGTRQVKFESDAEIFRTIDAENNPSRACFACQIKSIRYDDSNWFIEVNPDSVCLWTSESALTHLGLLDALNASGPLSEQLSRQQTLIGLAQ